MRFQRAQTMAAISVVTAQGLRVPETVVEEIARLKGLYTGLQYRELAGPVKSEAECATSGIHKSGALDGP